MASSSTEGISYDTAVQLLLENRFAEAEDIFGKEVERSSRHALLFAQVQFARACLSLSPQQAEECLKRSWVAEKKAADAVAESKASITAADPSASSSSSLGGLMSSFSSLWGGSSSEPAAKPASAEDDKSELAQQDLATRIRLGTLEDTMVQADAYVMGSLMQLLLGSYVKGAWNMRTAWGFYSDAFALLKEKPQLIPSHLHCIIKFGVGFFNLVVSLLPSTYLAVAEVAGFSGNRALALELLDQAHELNEFWSPFACLLLLYFYTQLAPLLGLSRASDLTEAQRILASETVAKYPNGALFVWMRAGVARLAKNNIEAAALNARAAELSTELPPLRAMTILDQAFNAVCMLDFTMASSCFQALADDLASSSETAGKALRAYQTALCRAANNESDVESAVASIALVNAIPSSVDLGADAYAKQSAGFVQAFGLDKPRAQLYAMEMAVLFDAIQYMDATAAKTVFDAISVIPDVSGGDAKAAFFFTAQKTLVLAALHTAMDQTGAAVTLLNTLISMEFEPSLLYFKAFGLFQLGSLLSRSGQAEAALEQFRNATELNDFHLQSTLSVKLSACIAREEEALGK